MGCEPAVNQGCSHSEECLLSSWHVHVLISSGIVALNKGSTIWLRVGQMLSSVLVMGISSWGHLMHSMLAPHHHLGDEPRNAQGDEDKVVSLRSGIPALPENDPRGQDHT